MSACNVNLDVECDDRMNYYIMHVVGCHMTHIYMPVLGGWWHVIQCRLCNSDKKEICHEEFINIRELELLFISSC